MLLASIYIRVASCPTTPTATVRVQAAICCTDHCTSPTPTGPVAAALVHLQSVLQGILRRQSDSMRPLLRPSDDAPSQSEQMNAKSTAGPPRSPHAQVHALSPYAQLLRLPPSFPWAGPVLPQGLCTSSSLCSNPHSQRLRWLALSFPSGITQK